MKLFAYEIKNYKIEIPERENAKVINFRIVALTGECILYFSKQEKYPEEGKNEALVNVKNVNFSQLSVETYNLSLDLTKKSRYNEVYIGAVALEYSVVDIYAEVVYKDDNKNFLVISDEVIKANRLTTRLITEKDYQKDHQLKKDIYYKNFRFSFPKEFAQQESLNITVNCKNMGLSICAQKGEQFDFEKKCDFSSSSDNL